MKSSLAVMSELHARNVWPCIYNIQLQHVDAGLHNWRKRQGLMIHLPEIFSFYTM